MWFKTISKPQPRHGDSLIIYIFKTIKWNYIYIYVKCEMCCCAVKRWDSVITVIIRINHHHHHHHHRHTERFYSSKFMTPLWRIYWKQALKWYVLMETVAQLGFSLYISVYRLLLVTTSWWFLDLLGYSVKLIYVVRYTLHVKHCFTCSRLSATTCRYTSYNLYKYKGII